MSTSARSQEERGDLLQEAERAFAMGLVLRSARRRAHAVCVTEGVVDLLGVVGGGAVVEEEAQRGSSRRVDRFLEGLHHGSSVLLVSDREPEQRVAGGVNDPLEVVGAALSSISS